MRKLIFDRNVSVVAYGIRTTPLGSHGRHANNYNTNITVTSINSIVNDNITTIIATITTAFVEGIFWTRNLLFEIVQFLSSVESIDSSNSLAASRRRPWPSRASRLPPPPSRRNSLTSSRRRTSSDVVRTSLASLTLLTCPVESPEICSIEWMITLSIAVSKAAWAIANRPPVWPD